MTPKYTDGELRSEINAVLDKLQARQETWRPAWVTQQICKAHRPGLTGDKEDPDIDNPHVAFWVYAGYTLTRKLSTDCINDRADPPLTRERPPDTQLPLPGFDRQHLQDYYVVKRNGEDIAVCVLDLNDDEILARAALYRGQSRKALAHAKELERFVEWRREHRGGEAVSA